MDYRQDLPSWFVLLKQLNERVKLMSVFITTAYPL
jgi:hypothetical protein